MFFFQRPGYMGMNDFTREEKMQKIFDDREHLEEEEDEEEEDEDYIRHVKLNHLCPMDQNCFDMYFDDIQRRWDPWTQFE